MTMRLSTGLRNLLANGASYAGALENGRIEIYTGAQPTSADAAVTGTLLCTITNNSGALTAEVASAGTVTLAGSAGSVNTITVNGINILGPNAVPFDGTLAQTALDVAAAINNSRVWPGYSASAAGAVVTISGKQGAGAAPNGYVVSGTLTTLTATYANMAGGVAPVNGLQFAAASAGAVGKLTAQVWSGLNAATGTAGWFRQYGPFADTGALDSTALYARVDGAVATSGGEMNLNSTAFTSGATTTVATGTLTVPAQ
jgi:hypothetical protein